MTAAAPKPIDLGNTTDPTPDAAVTFHKVDVEFHVKQDGQPFSDHVNTYQHCDDSIVASIMGMTVDQANFLGFKGDKPKNQQFDIVMFMKVDGTEKARGEWNGISREAAMLFERHVLNIWLHGNNQTAVANKAKGKI
jgi:hypothetical protein